MTALPHPRVLLLLALPVVLVGGGVAAGGLPGFLIGFTGALVAVDRALDLGSSTVAGAEQAYRRLARRRRRAGALEYLPDDVGWAATAPRRRLGTQTIEIASVVGTTDRHKAESFDRDFRPPQWSRIRWQQMYLAAERGASLPPVSVYRVGNRHYLRDGHHRVSVARAGGADAIEAQVVELRR